MAIRDPDTYFFFIPDEEIAKRIPISLPQWKALAISL